MYERVSRRTFLRRSVGVAVLFVGVDLLPTVATRVRAAVAPVPQPQGARYYLYGLPATASSAQVEAGAEGGAVQPTTVATALVTRPVRSPDQAVLGLVELDQGPSDSAITVTNVASSSSAAMISGTIVLPGVSDRELVLVTPTFAADSSTLCLVLSVSELHDAREVTKLDPTSGMLISLQGGRWSTRHLVLYFDGRTGSFSGPYDLGDAPSLARVNVVADDKDLYIWTIQEPAALIRSGTATAAAISPRLAAYPLGSGTPRFAVDAAGPWPVNDEPTAALASGDICRLVEGAAIQVVSTDDGSVTTFPLPGFEVTAKPMVTMMEQRVDGLMFCSAPSIGRALIVDPRVSFEVVADLRYPIPAYASGAPASKVALSASGDRFYVPGDASQGGVVAYATSDGRQIGSFTTGRPFTAVVLLPSGNVLGLALDTPRVSLLTPDLQLVGETDIDLQVAAVI
jgi:hypothetical protein